MSIPARLILASLLVLSPAATGAGAQKGSADVPNTGLHSKLGEEISPPGIGARELILHMGQVLPLAPEGPRGLSFEGKAWISDGEFAWGPWTAGMGETWTAPELASLKSPEHLIIDEDQTLIYDGGEGTWGMLRILERSPDWVRVEQVVLTRGESLDLQSKSTLTGASEPEGNRLRWSGSAGESYSVTRLRVGPGLAPEELAEVEGQDFVDTGVQSGVLYEYAVYPVGGPPAPAARLRLVRQDMPGDWPLELEVGLGLDLLSGAIHGPNPDFEVHQIIGSQVLVRASETSPISTGGKGAREDSWLAPDHMGRSYLPRIRSLEIGTSAFFYLTEVGIYGRISLQRDGQGRVFLLRSLNIDGRRWLPLEPELAGWQGGQDGVILSFKTIPGAERKALPNLTREVEWEREPGSGRWEVLTSQPPEPETTTIAIAPDNADLPLVQLRFRHRTGPSSASIPSPPTPVLAMDLEDADAVERVQQAALKALFSEDYGLRYRGEHVLRGLGAGAWPALLDIYAEDRGIPSDLARQILLSPEGLRGGQLAEVMRIAGATARLKEPVPGGWFVSDPTSRMHRILMDYGRAQVLPWLELVSRMDPDPRVREMAGLLSKAPQTSRPFGSDPEFGASGLWSAVPPGARPETPWPDWDYELEGADPLDAGAAVRASTDLSRPLEAQGILALARLVEEPGSDDRMRAGTMNGVKRALLGLGLIELHRQNPQAALLDALRTGVVSGGANLMAWRDLIERRFHSSTDAWNAERETVRVPEASLESLQQVLGELQSAGITYVDVILPAGTYTPAPGMDSWLDLQTDGLALIGEGDVNLQVGLRAENVVDLVVAGCNVHNRGGMALVLTGASLSLRNGDLRGAQSPITLQSSFLEMEGCRILQSNGRESSVALRMMGPSVALASGCLSQAGTWILGDEGLAYLDRSLVDGQERPVFQGQRGGRLVLRDSVLWGGSAGFQGLDSVWLEGVLSTLRNQSLGPQNGAVYTCPEHNHTFEPWLENVSARELTACPLHSER